MAHDWYAEYLAAMAGITRPMVQMRRAHELDPYSLTVNRDLGFILYMARRYEEAIEQLHNAIEMEATGRRLFSFLAAAYQQVGNSRAALAQLERAASLAPGDISLRSSSAAPRPPPANAKRRLKSFDDWKRARQQRYVSPYDVAMIHLALGTRTTAFHWLERACEARPWRLVFLRVEPRLDPLHGDPRFQALLAAVGPGQLRRSH